MANDSIRGRQNVLRLTNKSGGGLVEGDVVIVSSGTAAAVTTTTTAGLNTDVIGVALETIAADAVGRICITGYVPKINLSASASLGDTFATHTVAKQAAPNATRGTGAFGEVLGTGTTPAAVLWGLPDPSGAGGVASDAIWDAAGDIVQGTGANTAARLAIGTAGQGLRVNAGATALEYVTGGRALIAQVTPTTTTASFTTIPATFNELLVTYVARSTKAAVTFEIASIFLNGDTTAANYQGERMSAYSTTQDDSACNSDIIVLTAANSAANSCTGGHFSIPFYASTTFKKQLVGYFGQRRDDSSIHQLSYVTTMEWENTAAVSQIDIVLPSGNFLTGSTFRLYGLY